MSKKKALDEVTYKVFRSGNPVYLYIGLITIVFVAMALFGTTFFLAGNTSIRFIDYVRPYVAFPADWQQLPTRFYTLLTYQFFHKDIFQALFNCLWLFWLGKIFMDFLKPRQFHFVFLTGGVVGALFFSIAYHVFPVFSDSVYTATLLGASASVMAIAVATITLVPDYTITLLFIGRIKLIYLVLAYIAIDLIGMASMNAADSFAHLGGALTGFAYIKLLRGGKDWSNWFKPKPKLKVVKNETRTKTNKQQKDQANQAAVDAILDKVSKSGYDKLTTAEKAILFRASKE